MFQGKVGDPFTRSALLVIIALLALLAVRPLVSLPSAQAQSERKLFIEPGTTMLRAPDGGGHGQGKIVVDLDTGDVWGFPTASSAPYPVVVTSSEPPVSKPLYLGRYDFSAMKR